MRLTQVTTRQLMIAVAVVALLLGFILTADFRTTISQGVGHRDTQLIFVVYDADSGQPVKGVTINLRDRDWDSNPISPYVLDLKTGSDGRALVSLNLQFVTSTDPTGREEYDFHMRYPYWEMRFSKEGYQVFVGPFRHSYKAGRYRDSHIDDEPQPPIAVRLRKLPHRQLKP